MSVQNLQRAIDGTAAILAKVSPDQLDQPTPCASWTVRDLVNHIIGGQYFFAAVVDTGESPSATDTPDFTAGDMSAVFAEGARRAVAAFEQPGAMDKQVTLPFGQMPGSAFVHIATLDTFQHGWDLARAIGQSTDFDAELAGQVLAAAQGFVGEAIRGPDGQAPFGPKRECAPDRHAADQLAAFLGRQV